MQLWTTYQEYLQTDHWQETTAAAKKRAGHKCQLCVKRNCELHTHHLTYERLGRELPEDMVVVCRTCHWFLHTKIWRQAFEAGIDTARYHKRGDERIVQADEGDRAYWSKNCKVWGKMR